MMMMTCVGCIGSVWCWSAGWRR